MKQKIIVVIPAYNEEKTIGQVIDGIKKYVNNIVLVDDCSQDQTSQIAKNKRVKIIKHKKNLGYDKSIDNGFKFAYELGATIILTFDADNQHNPQDIPKIIKPLLNNKADVAVGKRPYKARISEWLFQFYAKYKLGISDPLCGLKAYKREVYSKIGFFDNINSIGTQLMFNAKKNNFRIIEKDINLNRRKDKSRFGTKLKANYKIFKALLKIIFIN